jgi:hypothetical protein
MAILTQDRAILDDPVERQAIIDSGAVMIALGNGEYTTWEKLRCVVNHWDVIERLLRTPGPAAVTLLLSETRFEQF